MVLRRWTFPSLAAVLVAAAACSDQHATPGAPGPAIREGARINAQGTARFHFLNTGLDTTVAWASAAVVKGGVAMAPGRTAPTSLSEAAPGLLLQLGAADRPDPDARGVQTVTFTDTLTHHTYRLVATPGPAARAPARLEAYLDGEKVMQSDFTWRRDVGGWRAQSAHHTFYFRGHVLMEQDVTATNAEVAAASFDLMRPLARLGAALLPTEAQAAMATCLRQKIVYGLTLVALAGAELNYDAKRDPASAIAFFVATGAFELAEYDMLHCLYPNGF